jgi:hypothetical protein
MAKRKNPAAVALGKRGAKARMTKLTPAKRSEVARTAAVARWKDKPAAASAKVRKAKARKKAKGE